MTLQALLEQINQAPNIDGFAIENLLKLTKSTGNRFILNYSEAILSTPRNWISHYCRGLTLAGTPQNYQIIAKSFDRFYNLNETPGYLNGFEQIDFEQPFEVHFKYDGSIILEYLWNGKRCVNTRGSFANSPISEFILIEIQSDFEKYKAILDRREFALAVKNLSHKAVLFALLDGKDLKTSTQTHILKNYV